MSPRITKNRILTAAALLAASAAARPAPAGDWRDDVDGFARKVVDAGLAPGLSIAVEGVRCRRS
jgi:hypothetical protein